jgi:hypothetical protein
MAEPSITTFVATGELGAPASFDEASPSHGGAKGPVGGYGFIEVVGRAQASSNVEIRVRRGDGEFAILGTTTALPPTDPFVQPKPAPDASNSFAFRTSIQPGTYAFEVRLQSSSLEAASNLSLTDLVSAKKYSFKAGSAGTGRFVTPDVTVTAASQVGR